MKSSKQIVLMALAAVFLSSVTGCQNLPGTPRQQGAVVGGVGGAAAGAAIGGGKHQVLGAVIGGALGAGAGYVIGANTERISQRDAAGAAEATEIGRTRPATAEQARIAATADLNKDGFVTLDEVAAMREAGFSDHEMLNRLRATGQVFELTPEQQQFLRERGVSERLIRQMHDLNRDVRQAVPSRPADDIIGRPVQP